MNSQQRRQWQRPATRPPPTLQSTHQQLVYNMEQCLICMEEKKYMTQGSCGHVCTCLECAYKLRVVSKNKRCVMCNLELESVLVFSQTEPPPAEPDLTSLSEFKAGMMYADNTARIECLKLENKICFIGKCKAIFQTIPQFFTHLKSAHGRYMCQLCVDNRALLLKEQRVYRKEEYDKHLYFGDYDDENNLIFLHPYCDFCKSSHFNDDVFYEHLRKSHFTCNLCDPKTTKYVFYKDSEMLKLHYGVAHHRCPHPECQGMVAYKTRIDLEAHFAKEHQRGVQKRINPALLSGEVDDFAPKKTDEVFGVDFTNSLLVNRKVNQKEQRELEFREEYRGPVNYLHLMEHFSDERIQSMEDESDLIRNMANDFNRPVCMEEIRFKLSDKNYIDDFNSFMQYVNPILTEWQAGQVKMATGDFIRERIGAHPLFEAFWNFFGPILVYKYFFLYSLTVTRKDQRHQLDSTMAHFLQQLPFRHPNSIIGLYSWEDFFVRIKGALLTEVQRRLDHREIDPTKRYRMHPDRFVQLIGSIREARFQELIHWKYLNNFLENVDGKITLQRAILAPVDKIHHLMSRFSAMDLLICFTYFDLAMTKLDGESRKLKQEFPTNPNLLRLFMRKNPKIAGKLNFEVKSDAEDYREGDSEKPAQPGKIVQAQRLFKNMISQDADVKKESWDRYNALKNPPPPEPKVDLNPKISYENEAVSLKKIEESFPALEAEEVGGSIFDRMNTKKAPSKPVKKVAAPKKAPAIAPPPPPPKETKESKQPWAHFIEDSPPPAKKKSNFVLKEPEEEPVVIMNPGKKTVDLERDFPSLDPSAGGHQTYQPVPSMKFTKPTPSAKTTTFNPMSSSAVDDDEAFPSLQTDAGEESVFARMKQHKPAIPVVKKKSKQATTKVPTASKATILDRQDRPNEPLERHGRKAGRLQVDADYYYNDRGASDEESSEPVDIPPPKEELVQLKPKDLRRAEFPELGATSRNQEADLFERMKTAKKSQLEELASKFGYGGGRGGSAAQNVPVVAVKKKKK